MLSNIHSFLKAAYYGWREESIIIIREFSNIFALLFFVIIYNRRKKILLNINHNLTTRFFFVEESRIVTFLVERGFKFLFLDGYKFVSTDASLKISGFVTPLFPVLKKNTPMRSSTNSRPIIGLVGDFRHEKTNGFNRYVFIDVMSRMIMSREIDFLIGSTDPSRAASFLEGVTGGYKVIDTGPQYAYDNYLKSIDILILIANEISYRSRHSGTIIDAVSRSVIPIVPDLPVFRSQISDPVSVGLVYSSAAELHEKIDFAIRNRSFFRENMKKYLETRQSQFLDLAPQ
jgi:hypothetical protein